ncbi:zinc-binding dehydrogenase [Anaerovorax odorimutans]|uniref:Zinc-binding dehydrogenase n=1 Tax=Anaerovorax odorimutans TaxID=109327 RepID=A0ABT1RQI5_9FIRM|nr:zinc-binding dehydrogenase [Anaerovorax odorimutans]MCQ4637426.1 zinc-binding dehydrogenase [Anaerovorax odorimutans]
MKAIVLTQTGHLDNLKYTEERQIPQPGDNEIRVRVMAVGLNPVDYKLAEGWGDVQWEQPPVLGLDVAGIVDALGSRVTGFAPGERVFYHGSLAECSGGFAEYACTTAHTVSRLPQEIDFESAAALPCSGFTAYQAVIEKLKLDSSKTILIHGGAGGVGGYGVQLAKLKGARVFSTCSARNDQYVKSLGADEIIHYRDEDIGQRVLELTDGRGVDYVVNTVDSETATKDIDLLAFSGELVAVVELPDFSRLRFYEKGMSIHEVALGGAHINGDLRAQKKLAEIGERYTRLLLESKIKLPAIRRIRLEEIPEGLAELKTRHVSGKIVAVMR